MKKRVRRRLLSIWNVLKQLSAKEFCWYLGLTFLYRKFIPVDKNIPPTGVIWLLGLYFAIYGIASQRYENRLDQLETRISSLLTLTGTDAKKNALSQLITIQNWTIPLAPEVLRPGRTLKSLFGKPQTHYDSRRLVKDTFLSFKHDLSDMDLSGVDLSELNLDGANFSGANLRAANLSHCRLMNANFENAILHSTNFTYSLLDSANFQNSIVNGTLFYGVKIDTLILLNDNIYKFYDISRDSDKTVVYFNRGWRGVELDSSEFELAQENISRFLNSAKLDQAYYGRFGYADRDPIASLSHRQGVEEELIFKSYEILEQFYFTTLDTVLLSE